MKSIPVFQDTVQRSEAGIVSSHLKEREKSDQHHFLPEASLPALDVGVDRLYTKSFSFLVGLSLSLTDAGSIFDPFGSTTELRWGCTRGRPDSIST